MRKFEKILHEVVLSKNKCDEATDALTVALLFRKVFGVIKFVWFCSCNFCGFLWVGYIYSKYNV